ncbi:class I SAM-dependent methyltransferase [Candidatus Gottesmanbacteria bacterium]|nr:class I SAM-dependent methyltransferase [Candidatus Gottesmanbacteria bacterium]
MNNLESEKQKIELELRKSFFRRAAGIASIILFAQKQGLIEGRWQGKRVVELGCGAGGGLWALRSLGADVIGVDLQKYPSYFVKSPLVSDLPFAVTTSLDFLKWQQQQSFDAVLAFNTESDVFTPEVASQVHRVLKPDGVVAVTWQQKDLSHVSGRWPKWSIPWPYNKYQLQLYNPEQGKIAGSLITTFIDPNGLARGEVRVNDKLSRSEVDIFDEFLMVGRK